MADTKALRAFIRKGVRVRLSPAAHLQSRFLMYKVYILKSVNKPNKTYVGLTIKKVENRLKEHNSGLSKFTNTDKPWEVIYFESFYCKTCAEKREQFLKSGFGYRFRKLISEHSSALQNGE